MNKARVLPSTRLCCPRFLGSMTLSDSLPAACHFTALAYRFAFYDTVVRGRVSLVPDTTFTACRSLYTGGFFRAACPESSHVPWPSPVHTRLDILLSLAGFKLTMRQDSLHVAACNFASPFWVFHRASPLGSHHQVPASYEAVWSLPRPDSHRLVVPSFARRAVLGLTLTFHVFVPQVGFKVHQVPSNAIITSLLECFYHGRRKRCGHICDFTNNFQDTSPHC